MNAYHQGRTYIGKVNTYYICKKHCTLWFWLCTVKMLVYILNCTSKAAKLGKDEKFMSFEKLKLCTYLVHFLLISSINLLMHLMYSEQLVNCEFVTFPKNVY